MYPVTIHCRKLIFPYPAGIKCQIEASLGMGVCVYFPFSLLEFFSGLNLCGSYACCQSPWEFMCSLTLVCLEDSVSLEKSTHSSSNNLSTYPCPQIPEPWEEKFYKEIYLGLSPPNSLNVLFNVFFFSSN